MIWWMFISSFRFQVWTSYALCTVSSWLLIIIFDYLHCFIIHYNKIILIILQILASNSNSLLSLENNFPDFLCSFEIVVNIPLIDLYVWNYSSTHQSFFVKSQRSQNLGNIGQIVLQNHWDFLWFYCYIESKGVILIIIELPKYFVEKVFDRVKEKLKCRLRGSARFVWGLN